MTAFKPDGCTDARLAVPSGLFAPLIAVTPGLAGRTLDGSEEAETVIWLHDYCLDSSIWCEHWERLPAWRHIGVDLPGHGASLPAAEEEDLPALADRLAGVARAWDARHVVALGLGSLVALQMAIDDPGSIASLTLVSPWVGGVALSHPAVDMQAALAFELAIEGPGPWTRDRLLASEDGLYANAARNDCIRPHLERTLGAHDFWELRDGWLVRMAEHAHKPEDLAQIRASTLIVTGEGCLESDQHCAAMLGSALSSVRRIVLPNTGSLVPLEAPIAVCAAIEEHLHAATVLFS